MHSVAALGWALGAAGALAALTLLATNLGATGGFRLDAADLNLIVLQMFGDSGVHWMIAGGAALEVPVREADHVVEEAEGQPGIEVGA